MPTSKSPAVIAFEIEQATKREEADDFDAGLQATFPASDPISATAAGMPGGEANRKTVGDADAPRVDEALNAILAHRNDPYVETRERAAALQEEARSLGYRGQDVVSSARRQIRDQPMRAVALAALFGFVYGMIR
jgi:ElaB/YqjD/DUF883 family membrane-anchored ribosome-binding protein